MESKGELVPDLGWIDVPLYFQIFFYQKLDFHFKIKLLKKKSKEGNTDKIKTCKTFNDSVVWAFH